MSDEVERLIQEISCTRDFAQSQSITLQFNVVVGLLPPREREEAVARFIDALHEHRKK